MPPSLRFWPLATLLLLLPATSPAKDADAGGDARPPASTYDITPHSPDTLAPLGDLEAADHALWSHVGRTLVALAAVVALIYLLARLVLPRLATRFGSGQGAIRIVERVALDAKHALVLVRVGDLELLVGTGDSGVQLVAELSSAGGDGFAQALVRSRQGGSDLGSDGEAGPGGKHARSN